MPRMEPGPVGVVVVNIVLFRTPLDLLERTLESVLRQRRASLRVRLLSNDEEEGRFEAYRSVVEKLRGSAEVVSLQRLTGNVGFAGGHNFLLADGYASDVTHCIILNPDVVLLDDAVSALVETSLELRDACLLSGVLLLGSREDAFPPGDLIDSRGTVWTASCRHLDEDHGRRLDDVRLSGQPRPTSAVTGALILVPREVHHRIVSLTGEFFDEDFFAYREDAELGLRAGLIGVRSYVMDRPVGIHFRGSPGTRRGTWMTDYLGARNRFLLAFKYGALRPGTRYRRTARDLLVVLACLTLEWRIRRAPFEAWKMRNRMREKRVIFDSFAAS